MEILNYDLMFKLVLSALLGLVIGLERELKKKPLGLKTSPVISIISCLITIVSIESAYMYPSSDDILIQMDPLRLAAQIVSGIGFIGAGVILKRGNDHISGLTTAAMIWGAAGVGIAVGSGFFVEAISVVVLLIISVEVIPFILTTIGPLRWLKKEYTIKVTINKVTRIEQFIQYIQNNKIKISQTRIKNFNKDDFHVLELRVQISSRKSVIDLYNILTRMDDVIGVEIIT